MALTQEDMDWIIENLRQVETTIVTEFHTWGYPFEARQRSHSAGLRAIDEDIELLKDRVSKLEGRR